MYREKKEIYRDRDREKERKIVRKKGQRQRKRYLEKENRDKQVDRARDINKYTNQKTLITCRASRFHEETPNGEEREYCFQKL